MKGIVMPGFVDVSNMTSEEVWQEVNDALWEWDI